MTETEERANEAERVDHYRALDIRDCPGQPVQASSNVALPVARARERCNDNGASGYQYRARPHGLATDTTTPVTNAANASGITNHVSICAISR